MPPFPGDQSILIMKKHLMALPPSINSAGLKRTGAAVEDVIWKAMAKERSKRYQSASEFAADIEILRSGKTDVGAQGMVVQTKLRAKDSRSWLMYINDEFEIPYLVNESALPHERNTSWSKLIHPLYLSLILVPILSIVMAMLKPHSSPWSTQHNEHKQGIGRSKMPVKLLLDEGVKLAAANDKRSIDTMRKAILLAEEDGNDLQLLNCLLQCAEIEASFSLGTEASKHLESASQLLGRHQNDFDYAQAEQKYCMIRGLNYLYTPASDCEKMHYFFDRAIVLAQRRGLRRDKLEEVKHIAYQSSLSRYYTVGRYDEAYAYGRKLLKLETGTHDIRGKRLILAAFAAFPRNRADYHRLIDRYQRERPFGTDTARQLIGLAANLWELDKNECKSIASMAIAEFRDTGAAEAFHGYVEAWYLTALVESSNEKDVQLARKHAQYALTLLNHQRQDPSVWYSDADLETGINDLLRRTNGI